MYVYFVVFLNLYYNYNNDYCIEMSCAKYGYIATNVIWFQLFTIIG